MDLSIVECRVCGTSYWIEGKKGGAVASGPCCFGHFVLDVENYPSEYKARKAYEVMIKRREAAISARTAYFKGLARGNDYQAVQKAVAA